MRVVEYNKVFNSPKFIFLSTCVCFSLLTSLLQPNWYYRFYISNKFGRPYKFLSLDWCILCMGSEESIDYLFLHCLLTSRLWHKLFSLARMDWVLPKSIWDMIPSCVEVWGVSSEIKTLWQITCLIVPWILW